MREPPGDWRPLFKVVAFPAPRGVGPGFVMGSVLPLDRSVAEVVDITTISEGWIKDAPARVLFVGTVPNGVAMGIVGHGVLLAG